MKLEAQHSAFTIDLSQAKSLPYMVL